MQTREESFVEKTVKKIIEETPVEATRGNGSGTPYASSLLPIRVFPDTMEVVEAVCKRSFSVEGLFSVEEKLGLFFLFQIIINLFLSFNCSNYDNVKRQANVGGGVEGQASSSSSGKDCDRLQDMR